MVQIVALRMRLTPCTKQRLHGEERGGEVSASLQIKRNVLEAEGNLFPGVCNRASQLPDCIWSHPAALAGEAAGWGAAQHRGWASPVRAPIQRVFPGRRCLVCHHPKSYRTRWAQPPRCQDERGIFRKEILIFLSACHAPHKKYCLSEGKCKYKPLT